MCLVADVLRHDTRGEEQTMQNLLSEKIEECKRFNDELKQKGLREDLMNLKEVIVEEEANL